jgi:predicted MFS family arabinose efflux permease
VLVALVRTQLGAPNPREGHLLEGVSEGLRFIATDPVLRPLTATGWVWNIASAGSFALLVPLLRTAGGLSAHETGLVLTCGAAAGLAAAPVLHVLQRRYDGRSLYLGSLFVSTVPTVAIGYARGPLACAAAIVVLNLVLFIEMSTFIGARQKRAPADLQARVGISGRMVMTSSLALGSLLASGLTGLMSLPTLFAVMGVSSAIVGLVAVRAIPGDV